jgi:cyclase
VIRPRIIPCLLLRDGGLVKTTRFRDPVYLGDPINIVRIFNDKEADEVVLLDITASRERRAPDVPFVERVAAECFMPLCYGGGVRTLEQIRELFTAGVEKVALNAAAADDPAFLRAAADRFGSQSIVVSIDVRRSLLGRQRVWVPATGPALPVEPPAYAAAAQAAGAGEILLQSVDRDGTMSGYDLELVRRVTSAVDIPVIACGGAGRVADLVAVVRDGGAAAAAAGSMFVFQGRHRAVLITTPSDDELRRAFAEVA